MTYYILFAVTDLKFQKNGSFHKTLQNRAPPIFDYILNKNKNSDCPFHLNNRRTITISRGTIWDTVQCTMYIVQYIYLSVLWLGLLQTVVILHFIFTVIRVTEVSVRKSKLLYAWEGYVNLISIFFKTPRSLKGNTDSWYKTVMKSNTLDLRTHL